MVSFSFNGAISFLFGSLLIPIVSSDSSLMLSRQLPLDTTSDTSSVDEIMYMLFNHPQFGGDGRALADFFLQSIPDLQGRNPDYFDSRRLIESGVKFPSEMRLRAGVLHSPPFAIVKSSTNSSNLSFNGFQPELMERLVDFAKQDNVSLSFEIEAAPPQYASALDLVANDCNTTVNPNSREDCNKYDLIVGDYYTNKDRALRIDFTPSWLSTTMSVIKFTGKTHTTDYATLTEVERAQEVVCVPDGTYLMTVVMEKFPKAKYHKCPTANNCLQELKAERCSLFVDDELLLRYRASLDVTLEVTYEKFNTQYMTWPMSYVAMEPVERLLIKRWIYAAVSNTTLDQLYGKYFQKIICPIGTAGVDCELPCDPNHGLSDTNGVCVCFSAKWIGEDCSVEVIEEKNMLSPTLKAGTYAMFGLNVLIICGCATWLYKKRSSHQVQVSQPVFLLLILFGCFISSSSILAFAKEESDSACLAIPWLYGMGFAITFATMFAKIRRIYIIFMNAAEYRRKAITNKETLSIVAIIVFIYGILLTLWTILDPLVWVRTVVQADVYGVPLESEGHCTSDYWIIWASAFFFLNIFLMIVACIMCYKARNIPTRFSEGKYLTIAMISNLQIFIVGVPVLIILNGETQTSFFMKSAIIWMNDLVVVALIFGNLIRRVDVRAPSTKNLSELVSKSVGEYRSTILKAQNNSNSIWKKRTSDTLSVTNESEIVSDIYLKETEKSQLMKTVKISD